MDWFERLTGFGEGSYEETRAKLKVDGRQIRFARQQQELRHRRV